MESDIWAVTLGSDADFYVTTTGGTQDTALTLAATQPAYNGVSYKVTITSAADEQGVNFAIVGIGVDGKALTETLAGGDTTTVTSTNYFVSITSITPDADTTGNITVGYGGDARLPMTRIKGVYYVASGSAGSIVVTKGGNSQTILNLATPGSATATQDLLMPGAGLRTADTVTDYSTVAVTNVTSVTLLCA